MNLRFSTPTVVYQCRPQSRAEHHNLPHYGSATSIEGINYWRVCWWLFGCCHKHHEQSQLEKESFSLQVIVHHEGSQEPKQRLRRNATDWLASPAFVTWFFFISTQDHLSRSGTTHSELVPCISITNQKIMPGRLVYRTIWYWYVISWGYLFLDDLRLYRINKKK